MNTHVAHELIGIEMHILFYYRKYMALVFSTL